MRLSCPARNGRSPGEESLTAAIAVQAIEAQPAFGQIKPMRGKVLACAEQHLGDVPANDRLEQEGPHSRRRKRKPGVQKGGPLSPNRQKPSYPPATAGAVCRRHQLHLAQSKQERSAMSRSANKALMSAPCQPRDNRRARSPARGHRPIRWLSRAEYSDRPKSGAGLHRHVRPSDTPDSDAANRGERLPPPFRGNAEVCKGKAHTIAGACRRNRE